MKKLFVVLIMAVVYISAANAQNFVTDLDKMFQTELSVKGGEINGLSVGSIVYDCSKQKKHGSKIEEDITNVIASWKVTEIKGKGNTTQFLVYHQDDAGKKAWSLLDNKGDAPKCVIVDGQVVIQLEHNKDMTYGDEDDGSSAISTKTNYTSVSAGYANR